MKILIGSREIAVPDFIAKETDKNKAEFHAFLKNVLTAQAEKIRINRSADNPFEALEAFGKLFNGGFKA